MFIQPQKRKRFTKKENIFMQWDVSSKKGDCTTSTNTGELNIGWIIGGNIIGV